MTIKGYPETVLSRGKVIVEGNRYVGRAGDGKFLKRGRCGTA
jgi:dihydropyrimidinase